MIVIHVIEFTSICSYKFTEQSVPEQWLDVVQIDVFVLFGLALALIGDTAEDVTSQVCVDKHMNLTMSKSIE